MKQISLLTLVLALGLSASAAATCAPGSGQQPDSPAVLLAQDDSDVDESDVVPTDHPYDVRDMEPAKPATAASDTAAAGLTRGIRWLGHAAFLIQDGASGKNIYIDPFNLGEGLPPADIVLITHDHPDHLSPEDLAKITGKSTIVVTIAAGKKSLPDGTIPRIVKPGDTLTVGGIRLDVVPAYNVSKQFHPKAKGHVGFVVHAGGRTIYHAGDTDLIPEMKNLKVDVALVPVGGTYTMDAAEAAEAVNAMRPKVAVPMHYGSIVGSDADAAAFRAKARLPVVILKAETAEPGGKSPAGKKR
jgi:L-ascorbate metabolism protein UlaG (beta-lactamase superfamily)